jgi:hypothetical protein
MKTLNTTTKNVLYVVNYLRGKWITKTNFSSLAEAEFFISNLTQQKNSAKIEVLTIK